MRFLLSLFLSTSCFAQIQMTDLPFLSAASSSSTWYPTNAAATCFEWYDSIPQSEISGSPGSGLCTDGQNCPNWTNITKNATYSGDIFNASGASQPVFHTSGGGPGGNKPRLNFPGASNNGMQAAIPASIATFTVLIVARNTKASVSHDIENLYSDNGSSAPLIRWNDNKIEMSAGTLISGATGIGTGYQIIVATFNGASSTLVFNGAVTNYISGNVGTTSAVQPTIGWGNPFFGGDICRVWGWIGVLSAGDTTSAVNQTKTDFGF